MPKPKIKGLLFDMDGVLIDAKEWHYDSLNRALNHFGFTISRFDHLVTYDGLPTKRKLEMLTKERGLPAGLHNFINKLKQEFTIELIQAKCRPLFHHEFALSKLRADGYKIAVASNSIRNTVELMMEKSNLSAYLDSMLSNEDVSHPKPDPELYLKAAANLSLDPSECLVIEDNEKGISAAKAAGAQVMVVQSVWDVNYQNITASIESLENL